MVNNSLQVIGFVFFVLGGIFILRSYGFLKKESVFVKYHRLVGYPLFVSGAITFIVGLFV